MAQAKTHREEFLAQIERIVPWGEWISIIKPHYYEGERGLVSAETVAVDAGHKTPWICKKVQTVLGR